MERTSKQLVEAVLAGVPQWKAATQQLAKRDPDAACARVVIEAFQLGECPHWKAACLLGAIGHPDGYATTLAILRAGAGSLSESYAGPALVAMRGEAAFPDLAVILETSGLERSVYEGAAYGLAKLTQPRVLDLLMGAVEASRIRMSTAGSILAERPLDVPLLLEWVRGTWVRRRTVAAWALFYRSASHDVDDPIPIELRDALFARLDAGGLPFTSAQEAMLRDRLSRPAAPLPVARVVRRVKR